MWDKVKREFIGKYYPGIKAAIDIEWKSIEQFREGESYAHYRRRRLALRN